MSFEKTRGHILELCSESEYASSEFWLSRPEDRTPREGEQIFESLVELITGQCHVREVVPHPARTKAGQRSKSRWPRMNFLSSWSFGAATRKESRLARSA